MRRRSSIAALSIVSFVTTIAALLLTSPMSAMAAGDGYAPPAGGGSSATTPGFSQVMTSQSVSSSGGTLNASAGAASVSLDVPAGTFSSPTQITITDGTNSGTEQMVVSYGTEIVAFGVNFSGNVPNKAVTLTIHDPSIPAGAKVYKLQNGQAIPVAATVSAGAVVITFAQDPDFVVLSPKQPSAVAGATNVSTGIPVIPEVGAGLLLLAAGTAILVRSRKIG